MLPKLSFLPDGTDLDGSSVFSLASRWGRGNSYVVSEGI